MIVALYALNKALYKKQFTVNTWQGGEEQEDVLMVEASECLYVIITELSPNTKSSDSDIYQRAFQI